MRFNKVIALLFSFTTFISFSLAAPVPNKYKDSVNKYERYIFLLKNKNQERKLDQSQIKEIFNDFQNYISQTLKGDIIFNYNIIDGFSFDVIKQQTKHEDLNYQLNLLSNYIDKELKEYNFVLEKDLILY